MPLVNCALCKKETFKSPSRIKKAKNNYCSKQCANKVAGDMLSRLGSKNRFNSESNKKYKKKRLKNLREKISGAKHWHWKENPGYRALHYWIRRQLGIPTFCLCCGVLKKKNKPKFIQWANIDKKYRRDPVDYIPLCSSCHKFYDLSTSTPDVSKSIRRSL